MQHDGRAGYQGAEFERLREEFPIFLAKTAHEIGVKAIAEESNVDALEKFSATKSAASAVASKMGIKHLFCEPSIQERELLGIMSIENPADFKKRENFWLEKLKTIDESPTLFILGAKHVSSFSNLANNSGLSVRVVDEYYGKEFFPS